MAEAVRGLPGIWCTGNHDINYGANADRRLTEDELYAAIGAGNTAPRQDADHPGRNYGFLDFENQRIRCIYLNTIDQLTKQMKESGLKVKVSREQSEDFITVKMVIPKNKK